MVIFLGFFKLVQWNLILCSFGVNENFIIFMGYFRFHYSTVKSWFNIPIFFFFIYCIFFLWFYMYKVISKFSKTYQLPHFAINLYYSYFWAYSINPWTIIKLSKLFFYMHCRIFLIYDNLYVNTFFVLKDKTLYLVLDITILLIIIGKISFNISLEC